MLNQKLVSILFLVLCFGGPVLSQDNFSKDIDSLESDKTTTDEVRRDAKGMQLHDQKIKIEAALQNKGIKKEDLNNLMLELSKSNPEGFDKMKRGELSPEESSAMMKEAFSKLPKETVAKLMGSTTALLDNKLKALSEGLNSVPYETALENIKTQVNASKAAPLFKIIPKSHEFLTNFLRDHEASSKFFGVIKDRERLYVFAGINILLLLIGWRLKVGRKKMNYSTGESFSKGFSHFLVFSSLKLLVFWYFFSPEVKPIWAVIQKTYS